MTAKTIVITGANSGIGFASALYLARAGHHVVMACRNADKAERAEQDIRRQVTDAKISVLPLDIADLDSIANFARRYAAEVGHLDILINNAGIAAVPFARTRTGIELNLATNYLGAFALTGELLHCFRQDRPGRIVNVNSLMHRFGRLNLEDLNWETRQYNEWQAYFSSKIALLLFTMELDRRLKRSGGQLIALAAHPGLADTNISTQRASLSDARPVSKWIHEKIRLMIPSAESAARSILYAATQEDLSGGEFCGPRAIVAGKPVEARVSPVLGDTATGKRLWALSESLTGVCYLSDV